MQRTVKINNTLRVDRTIFDFLANTNNIICSIILNCETLPGVNYLSNTDKADMISYLPDSKIPTDLNSDHYASGIGRVTIKVGRIISKLIPPHLFEQYVRTHHVEEFVNLYKSWFDTNSNKFEIVEGEDIRKWYLDSNYMTPFGNTIGTLWNSCMRYQDRQKYLDIYCKNSGIKMLILTNSESKLRARALLWEDVKVQSSTSEIPETIKVMDRIYSVFDSDVFTLKRWATQNGYIPKMEQNAKSHRFFDIKGNPVKIKASFKLENKTHRWYPYLDTFTFFDYKRGILHNDEFGTNWDYKLVQANGSLHPPEPEPQEEDNGW